MINCQFAKWKLFSASQASILVKMTKVFPFFERIRTFSIGFSSQIVKSDFSPKLFPFLATLIFFPDQFRLISFSKSSLVSFTFLALSIPFLSFLEFFSIISSSLIFGPALLAFRFSFMEILIRLNNFTLGATLGIRWKIFIKPVVGFSIPRSTSLTSRSVSSFAFILFVEHIETLDDFALNTTYQSLIYKFGSFTLLRRCFAAARFAIWFISILLGFVFMKFADWLYHFTFTALFIHRGIIPRNDDYGTFWSSSGIGV